MNEDDAVKEVIENAVVVRTPRSPAIDLRIARQERFARVRASGASYADAYKQAGYSQGSSPDTQASNAWKLGNTPEVKARIEYLRKKADDAIEKGIVKAVIDSTARVPVTRNFVLDELTQNVRSAKETKRWSDVNRALELLGKEIGMFIDKSEVRTGDLEHMSTEELDKKAAELKAKYEIEAKEAAAILGDPESAPTPEDPFMSKVSAPEIPLPIDDFENPELSGTLQ